MGVKISLKLIFNEFIFSNQCVFVLATNISRAVRVNKSLLSFCRFICQTKVEFAQQIYCACRIYTVRKGLNNINYIGFFIHDISRVFGWSSKTKSTQ